MEANTVVLPLKEYNELRDFKTESEENLKNQKFIVIQEYLGLWGKVISQRKYYFESEIVLDFQNRNKNLEKENNKLLTENKELKNKEFENKELLIKYSKINLNDEIKKMSIFKIIKIKFSKG